MRETHLPKIKIKNLFLLHLFILKTQLTIDFVSL